MSHFKAALGVVLCLGLGACATSGTNAPERMSSARRTLSFSAGAARDWLNRYRQSKGLQPVVLDSRLNAFAQAQANAMASSNQLSHSIGGGFSDRVKAAGLYGAGENVSYGMYNVPDAMRQWQNSPGHNANLLMARATRFGIAVATGGGRVYWAMVVAGDPPIAGAEPVFGDGPMIRIVRRPVASSGFGGLFGN